SNRVQHGHGAPHHRPGEMQQNAIPRRRSDFRLRQTKFLKT
ncbi:hypothetical protein TNCV_4849431, partial [Trichonephila clavipes]